MKKPKIDLVILTNGKIIKRPRTTKNNEYLAKVISLDNIKILALSIPSKIKGIVRAIILKFIYKQLSEYYHDKTTSNLSSSTVAEYELYNIDECDLITFFDTSMSVCIHSLEKYIKDFDKGAYKYE